MAVPKKRRSKSRKRSHRSNWREEGLVQVGRALSKAVSLLRGNLKENLKKAEGGKPFLPPSKTPKRGR